MLIEGRRKIGRPNMGWIDSMQAKGMYVWELSRAVEDRSSLLHRVAGVRVQATSCNNSGDHLYYLYVVLCLGCFLNIIVLSVLTPSWYPTHQQYSIGKEMQIMGS